MQYRGMGAKLSRTEEAIISCFQYGKLCFPSIPNATESQIKQALAALKKKQLIKGASPYELTRKGLEIYSSLPKVKRSNYHEV